MASDNEHARLIAAGIPGAKAVSRSKLVVSGAGGGEDGSWILDGLLRNERVMFVEEKPRYNLLNKWSAATVQSGIVCPPCSEEGCPECGRGGGMTPVWDMGLKGQGEVLACGDTGHSPRNPPYPKPSAQVANKFSPNHVERQTLGYKPCAGIGSDPRLSFDSPLRCPELKAPNPHSFPLTLTPKP